MTVIRSGLEKKPSLRVHQCCPFPMGATVTPAGARFVVFSRHATAMSILLFSEADQDPASEIELDSRVHRTGDLWHVEIEGLRAGQLYTFRADGPFDPEKGHRFHPGKLLLDPYARALSGSFAWDLHHGHVLEETDTGCEITLGDYTIRTVPKCILMDSRFDWQEDRHPRIPLKDSIIYEMHVRGFTRHESAGVTHPGTYQGVVEKIPYLKDLGVTAVELLPIHEFDQEEVQRINPLTGLRLKNYWGYSTVGFFAPKGTYAAGGAMGEQVDEFKSMVRALHEAGIELILDVVFNHTAEGGAIGSTLSFRGLDNSIYYLLEANGRTFKNYSGCGNTVNCNHPLVSDFILDCLRYWVVEMHVDGFRFDLASVLARGQDGELLENPPLVHRIAEDALLRDTKIIAEAWDAAGAYQVGSFHNGRWAEWNGRYRDDVRRFWRGDSGMVSPLATRIAGSSDLYLPSNRKPCHSINYITSHDGFTLRDLVSYRHKHNDANGEQNRDGDSNEVSWNNGEEGESGGVRINQRRRRLVKSLLTTLMVSQGVPMLLSGDEMYRSQGGNNNTYCQDNEVSWLDWNCLEAEADLYRFVRGLITFRKQHPVLRRSDFFAGKEAEPRKEKDIIWFGPDGKVLDWSEDNRSLSCLINGDRRLSGVEREDADLFLAFNREQSPVDWSLPPAPSGSSWLRVVDTGRFPPHDFLEAGKEAPVGAAGTFRIAAGAAIVLMAPRQGPENGIRFLREA